MPAVSGAMTPEAADKRDRRACGRIGRLRMPGRGWTGTAGSRRKAPGVSHLEPLIDVLVHGQDIAIPLGRFRPMPVGAAVAAADRVWPSLFPWRAERKLNGFRLVATDCSWSAGDGLLVAGPIGAILLLLTGRRAGLARLSGPGARELSAGSNGSPG